MKRGGVWVGTVCAVAALLPFAAACGDESSGESRKDYSITLPEGTVVTRSQIEAFKEALESGDPDKVPALPLAASVFDLGSSEPHRDDPSWTNTLETLRSVRSRIVDYDWIVVVEGYTDSTGSIEVNKRLSEERAGVTAEAIRSEVGLPVELVVSRGMGIGGADASNRKIVVRFERKS